MKKGLLVLSALLLFSYFSFAQKGEIKVGLGVDVALPLGDFGEYSKIGFGGTAKGHYGISEEGEITFTTGYLTFGSKESNEFMSAKTSMIPFMPGYRHKFSGLYVEPQLGLVSLKSKVSSSILEGIGMGSVSASTTKFSYAVGGGVMMDRLDLGVRFQGISGDGGSMSFIGARVGYVLFSK